jgi:hypothetical protein
MLARVGGLSKWGSEGFNALPAVGKRKEMTVHRSQEDLEQNATYFAVFNWKLLRN